MTIEKYINTVGRKLNLPREIKKRVLNDFRSSIAGRREEGLTDSEIISQLGSPSEVAAEFNAQMKDFACIKSPWRWIFLGATVIGVALIGYCGTINWLSNTLNRIIVRIANTGDMGYIGIIGGADGPTSIFVTAPVDGENWHIIIGLLLVIVGLIGFFVLRKRPAQNKHTE